MPVGLQPGGVHDAMPVEEHGQAGGLEVAGEGKGEQQRVPDLLLARFLGEPVLERLIQADEVGPRDRRAYQLTPLGHGIDFGTNWLGIG